MKLGGRRKKEDYIFFNVDLRKLITHLVKSSWSI